MGFELFYGTKTSVPGHSQPTLGPAAPQVAELEQRLEREVAPLQREAIELQRQVRELQAQVCIPQN